MRLSPRLIAILRGLLLTLASLGTALGLFVLVENWRGDRAWAAIERELQAKGERLDYAALRPPPVPDDENLFKAPLLARLLYDRAEDAERKKLLADTRLAAFHKVTSGFLIERPDFAAWRETLAKEGLVAQPTGATPAADVLAALEPLRPLLDELREAARSRPRSALEPRATPFEAPQVSADAIHLLSQAMGVRTAVEIELAQASEAHADLVALQRLANAFAASPANLLQVLVSLNMHGIAAGAISGGCKRHLWTDAQLRDFQRLLADFQPLARFNDALRNERACSLYVLDAKPPNALGASWPWWLFHGWIQQNKAAYCRWLDAGIFAAVSPAPERILLEQLASLPAKRPSPKLVDPRHPYDSIAHAALSNIENILRHFGESAERIRLHGVAWAIERHRLARGQAPATLDELVPAFLPAMPAGIFDGQPLRYVPRSDHRGHRLYSLGKNGRDDGGEGDDLALTLGEAS